MNKGVNSNHFMGVSKRLIFTIENFTTGTNPKYSIFCYSIRKCYGVSWGVFTIFKQQITEGVSVNTTHPKVSSSFYDQRTGSKSCFTDCHVVSR